MLGQQSKEWVSRTNEGKSLTSFDITSQTSGFETKIQTKIMTHSDSARKALTYGIPMGIMLALLAQPAAATTTLTTVAQTSVTELEIIHLLGRIHELLRNIAYLLGPIILLHGITFWALGSKDSKWSERGYTAIVGGFMLFGLSLAMDILLQLAAFIGSAG